MVLEHIYFFGDCFNDIWYVKCMKSMFRFLGSVIFVYSNSNECVEFTYTCVQGVDSAFTMEVGISNLPISLKFQIPDSFIGKSPVYLYSGLEDFYPSYQSLKVFDCFACVSTLFVE